MAGINKVILIGRLGQDPKLTYFQSGDAVCNFSIATSESWKDKQTGEKKEKTEWHNVVAYRKLAEVCGQYLSKGREVYVEGKLQTRSYEKDGVTRYTTEIIADTVQFLGSRESGDGSARQSTPPPRNQSESKLKPTVVDQDPPGPYPDDDVPF